LCCTEVKVESRLLRLLLRPPRALLLAAITRNTPITGFVIAPPHPKAHVCSLLLLLLLVFITS
jgi:hypothetical protein